MTVGTKLDVTSRSPYLTAMIDTLHLCAQDDSWPLRQTAIITLCDVITLNLSYISDMAYLSHCINDIACDMLITNYLEKEIYSAIRVTVIEHVMQLLSALFEESNCVDVTPGNSNSGKAGDTNANAIAAVHLRQLYIKMRVAISIYLRDNRKAVFVAGINNSGGGADTDMMQMPVRPFIPPAMLSAMLARNTHSLANHQDAAGSSGIGDVSGVGGGVSQKALETVKLKRGVRESGWGWWVAALHVLCHT